MTVAGFQEKGQECATSVNTYTREWHMTTGQSKSQGQLTVNRSKGEKKTTSGWEELKSPIKKELVYRKMNNFSYFFKNRPQCNIHRKNNYCDN